MKVNIRNKTLVLLVYRHHHGVQLSRGGLRMERRHCHGYWKCLLMEGRPIYSARQVVFMTRFNVSISNCRETLESLKSICCLPSKVTFYKKYDPIATDYLLFTHIS